jgi:CheY-like chemotaxis protein
VPRTFFHLLLVEDNAADVCLFKHACRDTNIPRRLHVADDGIAALRFLQKEGEFSTAPTPDLIILDLNLPKLGGHEILQMIKADAELKSIPVVILTSSDCRREMLKAYHEGAACFITKPTDVDEYFKAVRASAQMWLRTAQLPRRRNLRTSAAAGGR